MPLRKQYKDFVEMFNLRAAFVTGIPHDFKFSMNSLYKLFLMRATILPSLRYVKVIFYLEVNYILIYKVL